MFHLALSLSQITVSRFSKDLKNKRPSRIIASERLNEHIWKTKVGAYFIWKFKAKKLIWSKYVFLNS